MSRGRQVASKSIHAYVISLYGDVCWTPLGSTMVPVMYNIHASLADAVGCAKNYRVNGEPAFTMASRIPFVRGNEAGTGGGIISGVNCGWCRPVEHSKTWKVEHHWIVREGDLVAMNCAGPDGPANCFGKIMIVQEVAYAPPVSVGKTESVSTDPATGGLLLEETEEFRDPETDTAIKLGQRTVIDWKTGKVVTKRIVMLTKPDGTQTFEAAAGEFDPLNSSYSWKATTGALPEGAGQVDTSELAVDADGQLYFGTGDEAVCATPAEEEEEDITDDDPELLEKPEVKGALADKAKAESELASLTKSQAWLTIKTAADVAGIFDPSPVSDIVAAGMSLTEGDWVGLGLSIVSMAPYLGDAIAKPIKGAMTSAKVARLLEKMAELKGVIGKAGDALKNALKKGKEAIRQARGMRARRAPPEPPPPAPKPPHGPKGPDMPPPEAPKAPPSPGDGGFTPKGEGKKKTAREKLDEAKEAYARKVHREEMEKAWKNRDRLKRERKLSDEDEAWLAADERRRELAFDPAKKQFNVEEAKVALKAEEQGLLTLPVKRGTGPDGKEIGDDLVDGNGVKWDAKSAKGLKSIREALERGENVLVHGNQSAVDAAKQALGVTGNSEKLILLVTGP